MVQMVENLAIIIGMVVGIAPAEPGQKYATLTLQIERVEPFENYPMVIHQKPGDRVMVRVLPEQIASTSDLANSTISIRVRRGRDSDLLFAATDWKAETR